MTDDNPQHSKPCVTQPITQIQVVIFEMTFRLSIRVIYVILWTNYSAICLEAESDTRQEKWTNDQAFEIGINDSRVLELVRKLRLFKNHLEFVHSYYQYYKVQLAFVRRRFLLN